MGWSGRSPLSAQPQGLRRRATEPRGRLHRVPRAARVPALPHHLPGPPPLQHLQVRQLPAFSEQELEPSQKKKKKKHLEWCGSGVGGSGWPLMVSPAAQPRFCVAGPSTRLPTGRCTGRCPSMWLHAVLAGAEPAAMRSAATQVRRLLSYPKASARLPCPQSLVSR